MATTEEQEKEETTGMESLKKLLAKGMVKKIAEHSGSLYRLTGTVVSGNHIGKKIGFPTANLRLADSSQPVPANGVYATFVYVGNETTAWKAMTNIGTRPTFSGSVVTIETHIFDFDEDIYGERLTVSFFDRVRDEKCFSDVSDLIAQLQKDSEVCLKLLSKVSFP